jgi:cytochrome c biogenesis protein CcmG/thiol:disulfide interchange protein DsbE
MAPSAPAARPRRRRGRALARLISLLVVGLFLALLVYGLVAKSPNTGIDESLARSKAPAAPGFELPILQRGTLGGPMTARLRPALADGRLALGELRGTPVVLNFWASWCVPCREEAPLLNRSWRTARERQVLFVGLNMQDLTEDARDFMREFGVSYLNVRDQSNPVARRWGVSGLPETFFITGRGNVVSHVIGVISEEQMRAGIAAARSGRPAGLLEGGDRRSAR